MSGIRSHKHNSWNPSKSVKPDLNPLGGTVVNEMKVRNMCRARLRFCQPPCIFFHVKAENNIRSNQTYNINYIDN